MIGQVKRMIKRLRTLNVARIEDLPYDTSPPIQFTYEQTASLNMGNFTFDSTTGSLTPSRRLIANALYYFRTITLAADINELDFETNTVVTPNFQMFLEGDSSVQGGSGLPLFREAIQMVKFYDFLDYRMTWSPRKRNDQLYATFTGQIVQGPQLLGKSSVTLKAIIMAQEIVDENFIYAFRKKYPDIRGRDIKDIANRD